MATQYLSVNYGDTHNTMTSSSVYAFGRRRSSGDLKSVPSSPSARRALKKMYCERIWKSREDIKKESDPVAYTPEESMMAQDEDERIFLEYQRCAMANRRRKSFNDAIESSQNISPTGWNRLKNIFRDRKMKDSSFSETDSTCDDDSRRSSINDSASPPSTPSGKSSPIPRVSIKLKIESEDDYRIGTSFPSSWNRIMKIFKDKNRDEPVGYPAGPPVEVGCRRRGSCDSQLQMLRLCRNIERPGIPNIATSHSFEELEDLKESQILNTNGGWSRWKKKFKDGKSKPPVSLDIDNTVNDKFPKREINEVGLMSKECSSPYKKSVSISGKSRKSGNSQFGENALHNAVLEGDLSAVKKIIDSGKIDINYLKPPGLSALQVACAFGNMKIIEQLISNGSDVELRTWSGLSPLQIATLFGHFEVCQYLILSGASSVDVQNGFMHDLKLMSTVLVR